MCDVCHSNPCLSRCPNYTDKSLTSCTHCQESLYADSDVCIYDDEIFCSEECIVRTLKCRNEIINRRLEDII